MESYSEKLGLRGTGRTTRMIQEAIRLSGEGLTVMLVVLTNEFAISLTKTLASHQRILVRASDKFNGDSWNNLFGGMKPYVQVLIDHAVIETKEEKMLEMLHRFDPVEATKRTGGTK